MRVVTVTVIMAFTVLLLVNVAYGQNASFGEVDKTISSDIKDPESTCGGIVACQCGDTLTSDHVMWYDLTNCGGNGLVIVSDNVTLDCNGHSIKANNGNTYSGVHLNSVDGVTVKNCNLTKFAIGIQIGNNNIYSYNNQILNNYIFDTNYGIGFYTSDYNSLDNNTVYNTNLGIVLTTNSNNNDILNNHVDLVNGHGLRLEINSDNNYIYNNLIERATYGIASIGNSKNNIYFGNIVKNGIVGVVLQQQSINNTFTSNIIKDNSNHGFDTSQGSGSNILNSNIIENNGYHGFHITTSHNNIFTNNTFVDNTNKGLNLEPSNSNLIWSNTFVNNGMNAYESSDSSNNNWNNSETGNFWDDFDQNYGYPYTYFIDGPGEGIDFTPIGRSYPPEIISEPVTQVDVGRLYNYDVEVYYPGSFIIEYSLLQKPDGMIIDDLTGLINWTPDYNESGNYTVTVRVTDGYLPDDQTYELKVLNTTPPDLEVNNVTSGEKKTVTITATAYDPNDDDLTYYIDSPLFTQEDNVFTWTTGPYDSGEYDFEVSVTDGLYWDYETMHVTILDTCTKFLKEYFKWNCEIMLTHPDIVEEKEMMR